MVMGGGGGGGAVHLTTLFPPGKLKQAVSQYFMHIKDLSHNFKLTNLKCCKLCELTHEIMVCKEDSGEPTHICRLTTAISACIHKEWI